jgi:hypothetical protein
MAVKYVYIVLHDMTKALFYILINTKHGFTTGFKTEAYWHFLNWKCKYSKQKKQKQS